MAGLSQLPRGTGTLLDAGGVTMAIYFLGWKAKYEKIMIETLSRKHDVRTVVLPWYARKITGIARSISKRTSLSPSLAGLARFVNRRMNANSEDLLICNEGQVKRGLNPDLIATFPGTRILLVRDLVDAAFIAEMRTLFDHIYSYDAVQCEKLGMEYLEQFFPFNPEGASQLKSSLAKAGDKPRCFFLGRDKGRARVLEALADELITQDCKVDFNIVKDDTSELITRYHTDAVLSYEENLAKALDADVLIDINQPGQAGLTLRPLEAAFFNKKLITDNRLVKKLEFYHPDRFYILGEECRALRQFLVAPAPSVESAALRKHSPEGLMDQLLSKNSSIAA